MNEIAEKQGFLVAYPQQPNTANMSKFWNWFNTSDQQHGSVEPSLIAGITRQVMQDYNADPQRIYIAGLSAGGAAASIMASTYPDLYAAVGIHSGLACGSAHNLPSALSAMKGKAASKPCNHSGNVATIIFHGDKDNTVHPNNADNIISQLDTGVTQVVDTGQVPNGHHYTRTCYNNVSGKTMHEQWDIHGAGHAWSGGSMKGIYTDPKGVDASAEMVRFFLEHSKMSPKVYKKQPVVNVFV